MTRTREQDRKPSRAAGSTAITLVLLAVTAGFLWSSLSVGQTASWIPQWVLAATSLVLLLQLAADIRDHFSRPDDQSLPGAADGQSAWPALLWLGLMLLALWLLGVSLGVALFCAAYMRWYAQESWRVSAAFAIALGLGVQLLFGVLLQSSLYTGVVTSLL